MSDAETPHSSALSCPNDSTHTGSDLSSCAWAPPPTAVLDSGFLLQCFGLFPLRSDMGGESELGEQSTDLLINIVFSPGQPLRRVWGRLQPLDRAALDGLPCHLEVISGWRPPLRDRQGRGRRRCVHGA
jgi:hypothetical protein